MRALINVPSKAKKGEIVEIKTMLSHPMETGFRPSDDGKLVPRNIIKRFVCTYDGEAVFSADLFPAISANPFLSFTLVATNSGVITFSWTDDNGKTHVQADRKSVV